MTALHSKEAVRKAIEESEEMDRQRLLSHPPHEHVDSGWRCLADHGPAGMCYKCKVCGQWIEGKR